MKEIIRIRNAVSSDFKDLGQLMVDTYKNLEGFPSPNEQPDYYDMLANIGEITKKPTIELLIAENKDNQLVGGVVFIGDMKYYGSGGTATKENNAAGFRLLAVHPGFQGSGIGKLLTLECISRAKLSGQQQLIIHSTESMKVAWRMYEKLGFKRSTDLDFLQGQLPVFGFRKDL